MSGVEEAAWETAGFSCNGICLTASDIGLGDVTSGVAYPHPECELHGDPPATVHDAGCLCWMCMTAAFASSSDQVLRGDAPAGVVVGTNGVPR